MTKYFIGICIFILGLAGSIHCFIYYAWLATVSSDETHLLLYERLATYWVWITITLIALIVASALRIYVLHRKNKNQKQLVRDNA